jgi:hypothetical protein
MQPLAAGYRGVVRSETLPLFSAMEARGSVVCLADSMGDDASALRLGLGAFWLSPAVVL